MKLPEVELCGLVCPYWAYLLCVCGGAVLSYIFDDWCSQMRYLCYPSLLKLLKGDEEETTEKSSILLVDRTVARSIIGYRHNTVVCRLSVASLCL